MYMTLNNCSIRKATGSEETLHQGSFALIGFKDAKKASFLQPGVGKGIK
jgi:hypothetical protein